MKLKNYCKIITTLLILFSTSCAKVGPKGATGPAGPTYTGYISGHVYLFDQSGSKILTGLSNVQLSLNNNPTIHPDSNGYYFISNITTGTYYINAWDSAFASARINPDFAVELTGKT